MARLAMPMMSSRAGSVMPAASRACARDQIQMVARVFIGVELVETTSELSKLGPTAPAR